MATPKENISLGFSWVVGKLNELFALIPTKTSDLTNDGGDTFSPFVQQDGLKTVNGNSLIGSGNLVIGSQSVIPDYTDIADMLTNQVNQSNEGSYLVLDASGDPNITFASGETKLQAEYRFNGTATGSINDYTLISAPYGNHTSKLASIAALKLTTDRAEGDYLETIGYYANTGIGGALYKKVDPSGLTANDMDIIEATDGSFWQLAETERVTPYIFGCRENTEADTARLQRFFDYCDETKLVGDFTGNWYVNDTIIVTGNDENKFNCGTLDAQNANIEYVVSIESSYVSFFGCFHVIGGTAANYASKVTQNGINFKNCLSRNYFDFIHVEGVKHWGLDMRQNSGKSNILNSIERLKVINCGAGEGTREYNFNATASTNAGSAGSTSQTSIIDVAAGVIPNIKPLEAIIDIAGRKHIVTAVDSGTNKITIYPWIKSGLTYPVNVKSHHGGGLLSQGGNSTNIKIGQFDALGCGQGFRSGGLYGATIQQLQAQSCGVGWAIGYDTGNNNLGVSVDKFHEEANDTAILQITRAKTSAVINSVSAMRLDKCYSLNPIDALDVPYETTKLGVSINWDNTRYEPKGTQMAKGKLGSQTVVLMGNNPEINNVVQKKTSPTIELKWDEEANKFGYDWFFAKLLGSGANHEPTGTITFNLDADDQAAGIRVMGVTSYTITGVLNPLNIMGFFDYANQNWIIKNFTQEEFLGLTIKKLNDVPILSFVRNDASTNNGDLIGQIKFSATDSQIASGDELGASIDVIAENDWGVGSVAKAAISFKTRENELQAPVERMRIRGDGAVVEKFGIEDQDGNKYKAVLSGTTANRPASPSVGQPYYNTTLGIMEWWNGTSWFSYNTTVRLTGYTIGTLPASPTIGDMVYITDGTDATVNPGTPVGGTGTTVRRIFYNGTVWTY